MGDFIAALPCAGQVLFYNYAKANAPYFRELDAPLSLPRPVPSLMQNFPEYRWLILIKNIGILEVRVPDSEADIFVGMSGAEIVAEVTAVMRKEAPKVGNYSFQVHKAPCFWEGGPVFNFDEIQLRNKLKQMR